METVVRNISELAHSQRSAAEQLVGHALGEHQQLVIQVVNLKTDNCNRGETEAALNRGELPAWCNVYEGLTDDEIAAIEQAISRRLDLTRPAT